MSVDLALGLATLLHVVPDVVAWSDDSPIWLLALGPAGAVGTYWMIYRYYRNTDKSHQFERDTIIEARPVEGGEERVDHITKTQRKRIDNENGDDYRRRVQRIR